MSLLKTFFYLKIIKSYSYIVTMILGVVSDLLIYIVFYIIIVLMFSMMLDVIGRNRSDEYSKIGWFMGNFMSTMRLSFGDFDFSLIDLKYAPLAKTHIIFWITWVVMVLFMMLIFLNFIIAEVSNSYQKVKDNIDSMIYKERAKLIAEAEDLMSESEKLTNKLNFPTYIVVRQLED